MKAVLRPWRSKWTWIPRFTFGSNAGPQPMIYRRKMLLRLRLSSFSRTWRPNSGPTEARASAGERATEFLGYANVMARSPCLDDFQNLARLLSDSTREIDPELPRNWRQSAMVVWWRRGFDHDEARLGLLGLFAAQLMLNFKRQARAHFERRRLGFDLRW